MTTPPVVTADIAASQLLQLAVSLRKSISELLDESRSASSWMDFIRQRAARDWIGEAEAAAEPIRLLAKGSPHGTALLRAVADVLYSFSRLVRFEPRWTMELNQAGELAPAVEPESAVGFEAIRAELRGHFDRLFRTLRDCTMPENTAVEDDDRGSGLFEEDGKRGIRSAGQEVVFDSSGKKAFRLLQAMWPADTSKTVAAADLAKICDSDTANPSTWIKNVVSRANAVLNGIRFDFELTTRSNKRGTDVVWRPRI